MTHKQIIESSLDDTPKNRVEMVRMMTLNVLKAISYPVASTPGAYNVKTDQIQGWQFGRPRKDKPVILEFYNRRNIYHVIHIVGMSQQEIDFIVSTIHERKPTGTD